MDKKLTLASVVIPFKNRKENLKVTLEHLADQTIKSKDYEIIIGSLDEEKMLRPIVSKYDNTKVISQKTGYWNPSLARNLALRRASGVTIILIDADIAVPPDFIEKHLEIQHQNTICVGRVDSYNENFNTNGKNQIDAKDVRWSIEPNEAPIKWALCWGGNLSFSKNYLDQDILFDESFFGWGGEDIEWAYQMNKKDVKFFFSDKVTGIHLPHPRNILENRRQEKQNFRRFLRKWPDPIVELVAKFGDLEANRRYPELFDNRLYNYRICELNGTRISLIVGDKKERSDLKLGSVKYYSLCGLSLPYEDDYFDEVTVLKMDLPTKLNFLISKEVERVRK